MSDDDKFLHERARRELHEATNELRKLHGKAPKPFVESDPPYCSFCGQGKNQVNTMIEGPGVYICDECVELCREIIAAETDDNKPDT